MGEGTVSKFVSNGYDDLWKILSADKEKLKNIDGLGSKSVDKIYESIEFGLTNQKIYNIMSASQIFGRGIGSRKLKLITDTYPNIMEIFKSKGKDHCIQLINAITGFDVKTTNKVVDSMDTFIEYYKKLIKIKPNVITKSDDKTELADDDILDKSNKKPNKYAKYSGKTIVFTGFRSKEVEAELEKVGAKITTSVSKNTSLVVAADIEEASSKTVKANELGIEVMSKDEFLKSLE
jgi:DNA ligase (NAD+)